MVLIYNLKYKKFQFTELDIKKAERLASDLSIQEGIVYKTLEIKMED